MEALLQKSHMKGRAKFKIENHLFTIIIIERVIWNDTKH